MYLNSRRKVDLFDVESHYFMKRKDTSVGRYEFLSQVEGVQRYKDTKDV